MGFPWAKLASVGKVAAQVLGATVDPRIEQAAEMVETVAPEIKGTDKKQVVSDISDAALNVAGLFNGLTAEQTEAIKAMQSQVIDDYVAYRNSDAKLRALIASFHEAAATAPQAVAPAA